MPNYLYPINTMRFGGLASGIDTETMVNDLMKVENMKVDRLKQDRQIVEWRRDAYRDITNKLRAFKDEFFNIAKPTNYMLSPNTYKNYRSTISGNETALSVSANADAVPGVYNIQVINLAESAKISGTKTFDNLNLNTKLLELKGLGDDGSFSFDDEGKAEIVINGETIIIDKDMTVRQLMNEINGNKEANVKLTYSSITGKFVLQSKDMGGKAELDVIDDKNTFLSFLGIEGTEVVTGKDAEIRININNEKDEDGLVYHNITSSSNTFTRDGITFNLYDITADDMDNNTVTIRITEDVEASFDKIKNFVDKYNELIDEINTKLMEKSYRDFPPLTDDQRSAMSEKDIELWEEKAMSGLLRNDPILQKLVYEMRNALNTNVEGVDIRLSDIGITTGKWYEHGKLYIDEQKLKEALAEDPDKVMELFIKSDGKSYNPNLSAEERRVRYNNVGIIRRISDILEDNIRTTRNKNNKKGLLLEKAGIVGDVTEFQNTMNDQLKEFDKRIDRMNEQLFSKEEYYWRQFTAMEKAIQQMNTQSLWLAQQLNMGSY